MLQHCESYEREYSIKFNLQKTQLICFGWSPSFRARFTFVGKQLTPLRSVMHLGHILTTDLNDKDDIQAKTFGFIRKANSILVKFSSCPPDVLCYLVRSFSTSFYGCSIWHLSSQVLHQLQISVNKVLRRIWHLPPCTHTNYLHVLSGIQAITNIVYARCYKLISSASCSNWSA